MKRTKVIQRVKNLADTYYLLGDIAEQDSNYHTAEAYRHAGRLADREAYKIEEKL